MSSYRTPKSGSHHLRSPSTSTPTILKKRNNTPLNNVPKPQINFNLVNNLKALLVNFNQNNDKEKHQYNNLICDIRDAGIEIKVSFFILFTHIYEALVIIKYSINMYLIYLLNLKFQSENLLNTLNLYMYMCYINYKK